MANAQHPGFLPMSFGTGGTVSYVRRRVLTNNTTEIALQDAVNADTNGNILGISAGAQATAVDSVAMGASYVNTSGERVGAKSLPAATLYTSSGIAPENASYVFCVENAPLVKYRASVDDAIVLADLRANCSVMAAAAVSGISRHEIDSSTKNNTATLPIRLLDFVYGPENDVDAADAHVICTINVGVTEPALTTTGLA